MSTPVILLQNTGDNMSISGTPYQTQAWYGYGVVVNTVSIKAMNFIGKVLIEGSIASSPSDSDWAAIFSKTYETPSSETIGETFEGNWLWIRARIDRSSLTPSLSVAQTYGVIDNIMIDNTSNIVSANNGSSESVTVSNVGTGKGIFKQIDGTNIKLKSIVGAGGLTITENTNDLTLTLPAASSGIAIRDNYVDQGVASAINFSGAIVSLSGGVANISIDSATDGGEYAHFLYTSGNSANFTASDAIVEKSGNLTIRMVDAANCIVEFTFANRPNPPSSVAIMGQNYDTNKFVYTDLSPAISTRTISVTGTSEHPNIFGGFQKMTLQLRLSDTGASAGFGQRPHCAVIFKF